MIDENDNPPLFEEDAYTFTIIETDIIVGDVKAAAIPESVVNNINITSVGYVTAVDSDDGSNAAINYRILSGNIGMFS